MKAFSSALFPLPLPEGHPFPMRKYARLREILIEDAIVAPGDLLDAPLASTEDLVRVHDAAYVRRVDGGGLSGRELRRLGFPWSHEMAVRARASVGASLAATRAALAEGFGASLAGGTHHAHRDFGAGYCVYNDFAVAAAALLAEGAVSRILIVDLDVHQGDGTARILAEEPRVFTFSVHGRDNFPTRKAASDLDVELPTGTRDAEYLDALAESLGAVHARFGAPELVLYLAGADPHEDDRFGRLKLTRHGLARRDAMVFGSFTGVPVAVAMGGGYGPDVEVVARIHASTIATGAARALPRAAAAPPTNA